MRGAQRTGRPAGAGPASQQRVGLPPLGVGGPVAAPSSCQAAAAVCQAAGRGRRRAGSCSASQRARSARRWPAKGRGERVVRHLGRPFGQQAGRAGGRRPPRPGPGGRAPARPGRPGRARPRHSSQPANCSWSLPVMASSACVTSFSAARGRPCHSRSSARRWRISQCPLWAEPPALARSAWSSRASAASRWPRAPSSSARLASQTCWRG